MSRDYTSFPLIPAPGQGFCACPGQRPAEALRMGELNTVIAPSPSADWTEVDHDQVSEVRLSRTRMGRVFEKHILSFGELIHPVTKTRIRIDKAFAKKLQENFDARYCDIVQVPLANSKNEHVENPGANLGEVLGIRVDEAAGKVYAQVDAREDADKFGRTYLGASAFMHLNYTDTKTDKKVGPTLLHVAVTNRPYVTGLDPYQEIVAASAEYDTEPALLQLSAPGDVQQGDNVREAAVGRTLEEILTELKADHSIDVAGLKTALSAAETAKGEAEVALSAAREELATKPDVETITTELAAKVKAALVGTDIDVKLSGGSGEVDADTIVAAVGELAQQNVKLSASSEAAVERIAKLERRNVEAEVDGLVERGFIVPAKRNTYLDLALSNRATFDALIPDEPVVALSREQGVAPTAEVHRNHEIDVDAELARLTAADGPAAQYLQS